MSDYLVRSSIDNLLRHLTYSTILHWLIHGKIEWCIAKGMLMGSHFKEAFANVAQKLSSTFAAFDCI